jgi:hypothetical protein
MTTLAPTTAILQTAIQSGMTHIDAVSEFVDNSFGPSAGDADLMTIIDASDGTMFVDQGKGVSDINLLFRLGDGNSRKSTNDIGRFGVGSKFGALTFGTNVTVMTVHEGVFHQFNVDWGYVLESGKWPEAYKGKGMSASKAPKMIREGGTIIIVKDLHKGRQRPADKTYVKRLGLRFMPALLLGKNIQVYRASSIAQAQQGSFKAALDIRQEFKVFMDKKIRRTEEHLISVNGKTANAMFGEVPDGDSTLTGIHITYGGRVIKSLDKLGKDRLPSKLFGRVDLGNTWKTSLSYNKTEITSDAEALEAEILRVAQKIIGRLANDEQSHITEKLAAEISNMIDAKFGKMLKNAREGDLDADEGDNAESLIAGDEDHEPQGHDSQSKRDENVKPSQAGSKDGSSKSPGGAFQFVLKPDNYGKNAFATRATMIEEPSIIKCEVELNKDVEIVAQALKGNPGNKPAVVLLCVHALAAYMVKNNNWIGRMFRSDIADQVMQKDMLDQTEEIYKEILKQVRTDKEGAVDVAPDAND